VVLGTAENKKEKMGDPAEARMKLEQMRLKVEMDMRLRMEMEMKAKMELEMAMIIKERQRLEIEMKKAQLRKALDDARKVEIQKIEQLKCVRTEKLFPEVEQFKMFPKDVLILVFAACPPSFVCKTLSLVCKSWRNLTVDNAFWTFLLPSAKDKSENAKFEYWECTIAMVN
jgi:hypothetical protein